MSGRTFGGIVGATIGFFVGGPMGALQGYSIGSTAGGLIAPDDLPTQYGPRLTDLKAQSSEYGSPIPIIYGTISTQGSVIWAADLIEVASEESAGGKGGPSQSSVSYTYFANFAVMVCEGPVAGIGRIWAGPGKRLIWDGMKLESGSMRAYLGGEDQVPDTLIEQYEGVGNVPAYRGSCYIVFENFALANDGNTLPFLTIEVGNATLSCPVPILQSSGHYLSSPAPEFLAHMPDTIQTFTDARTGMLYFTQQDATGAWYLNRIGLASGASGAPIPLASSGQVRIACDNNGTAEYIVQGQSSYTIVDLVGWAIDSTTAITASYEESDHSVTVMGIPLWDVVYKGSGQFGYLSENNTVNTFGYSSGAYGIHPVPAALIWGSTGSRSGGHLTTMGEFGAAASFTGQPSNFSPTATSWDLFIGGGHNILMSFADGAYYTSGGGFVQMSAPDFGTISAAVYDEESDRVFAWQNGVGLIAFAPSKLTPVSWPRESCIYYDATKSQQYADGSVIQVASYASVAALGGGYISAATYPNGDLFKVKVAASMSRTGTALSEVVADLTKRAGETRYDVSALAADTVDGYIIARQMEARAAIAALRTAYYFDAVESQNVIRFVKRGGATITTIADDDLAAREGEGGDSGDPLNTTRRMEAELPRALSVTYISAATNYSPAAKQARRLIGASGEEQTAEVPLVLSDTKAQEVAEVGLHSAWVERLSYSFAIPRKYSDLEPTDLVLVKGHLMRLTSIKATPAGVLQCEALGDDASYYAPHVVVTETPEGTTTVSRPAATIGELF